MHVELVALVVAEYDPAIAFFVDALGFELVEDSPSQTNDGRPKRWVVVRPPGGATGILLARADGAVQTGAVGDQFAGRVGLFLRVEDVAAAHARMLSAGVRFLTAPRDEPYGRIAVSSTSPATGGTCWALRREPSRTSPRGRHPHDRQNRAPTATHTAAGARPRSVISGIVRWRSGGEPSRHTSDDHIVRWRTHPDAVVCAGPAPARPAGEPTHRGRRRTRSTASSRSTVGPRRHP